MDASTGTPIFSKDSSTTLEDINDFDNGSGYLISNISDTLPENLMGLASISLEANTLRIRTALLTDPAIDDISENIATTTLPIAISKKSKIKLAAKPQPPQPLVIMTPPNMNTTTVIVTAPITPFILPTSTPTATPTSTPPVNNQNSTVAALPYLSGIGSSSFSNWGDSWGSVTSTNEMLSINSDALNSSAGAFLDAPTWGNYTFDAEVNWASGQVLSLIARHSDSSDYFECDITSDNSDTETMSIYRVIDGQSTNISTGGTIENHVNGIETSDMHVVIKVKDNTIQCGIGSNLITNDLNYGIPPLLLHGGIGIKTWDPQLGNAHVIVKQVSVNPYL